MKKIYVLRTREGSYEDVYQKNISAYTDESLAKAARDKKELEQQKISDRFDEFLKKSDELWDTFQETRLPELLASGMTEDAADEIYNVESNLLESEYSCDDNWERIHYYVDTLDLVEGGNSNE